MANTRALKARVASAEGILQITKSMKMASAAKLRRVQAAKAKLGPVARESRRLLAQALPAEEPGALPLLAGRDEKKRVCYVLLIGNRGLCGAYNSALVKYTEGLLRRESRQAEVAVCGSWGRESVEPVLPVCRRFDRIGDVPTAEEAGELAAWIKERYSSGAADEIVFVYQRYDSFLKQTPCTLSLLPLSRESREGQAEEMRIFEPDRESVLTALAELCVNSTVYDLLLEARCGEHAARMASMTSAADNTEELIAKLNLALNHARQAAVTTEITEIAGGAEALKELKDR